jgi:hypothetical protein
MSAMVNRQSPMMNPNQPNFSPRVRPGVAQPFPRQMMNPAMQQQMLMSQMPYNSHMQMMGMNPQMQFGGQMPNQLAHGSQMAMGHMGNGQMLGNQNGILLNVPNSSEMANGQMQNPMGNGKMPGQMDNAQVQHVNTQIMASEADLFLDLSRAPEMPGMPIMNSLSGVGLDSLQSANRGTPAANPASTQVFDPLTEMSTLGGSDHSNPLATPLSNDNSPQGTKQNFQEQTVAQFQSPATSVENSPLMENNKNSNSGTLPADVSNSSDSPQLDSSKNVGGVVITPLTLSEEEKEKIRTQIHQITPIYKGIGTLISQLYSFGGTQENDKIQKLAGMVSSANVASHVKVAN